MGIRRLAPLLLALLLPAACGQRSTPDAPAGPVTAPAVGPPSEPADDPPPVPVLEPPAAPVVEEPEPPVARTDERAAERERLVAHTIEARGVRDPLVLAAMRSVPRHLFMPEDRRHLAYRDQPVSIGWDQTISQPYIVASMTEEAHVTADSRVLEIGTGSGYQAAVLAAITKHVYSIEIKEPLAKRARESLDAAGYGVVTTKHGDGYYGWEEHAPFDAIVVTAAAPHVPPPLVKQLAPGGRMVIPVGPPMAVQDLMLVTKDAEGKVRTKSLYPVRFVPLTGAGTER